MSDVDTLNALPEDHGWVVILAGCCMFYMAWGIGANDCANNFATAWGSGALSFHHCVMVAAVCETLGAIFLGADVAKTFRKGIADPELYTGNDGRILIYVGMTSVLFCAATWLLVASRFGLPVSTTHSAVGGVISFAIITKGYDAVVWEKVSLIVASWFISPFLSLSCSCLLYTLLKKYVLEHENSLQRTKAVAPCLIFLTGFVISLFVIYKGAKGIGLDDTTFDIACLYSAAIALGCTLLALPGVKSVYDKLQAAEFEGEQQREQSVVGGGMKEKDIDMNMPDMPSLDNDLSLRQRSTSKSKDIPGSNVIDLDIEMAKPSSSYAGSGSGDIGTLTTRDTVDKTSDKSKDSTEKPNSSLIVDTPTLSATEKMWCGFCWVTASFESLAHGGNDVANSVGPFAAVLAAKDGDITKKTSVPEWVVVMAGFGIAIGLVTFGRPVMESIGKKVTSLKPSKAFAAELSATFVILLATRIGIPISTTHASVGAVIGVAIADQGWKDGLNHQHLYKIFASWIFTLPIVGLATGAVYSFLLPCVVPTPIV